MDRAIHEEFVSSIGKFLIEFVVLDNTIAGLFSAAFGIRQNTVEIVYANVPLQARLECLAAIAAKIDVSLSENFRAEISEIVKRTRALQTLRNALSHNVILDTNLIVVGAPDASPRTKKGELYIWKMKRDGAYEPRKISEGDIEKARREVAELSAAIVGLCVSIRMTHGLRP